MEFRKIWQKLFSLFFLVCILFSLTGRGEELQVVHAGSMVIAEVHTRNDGQPIPQPEVRYAVQYDLSQALNESQALNTTQEEVVQPVPRLFLSKTPPSTDLNAPEQDLAPPDPVLQDQPGLGSMPATEFNFEGIDNVNDVLPPDPNGDIGPNHYVQWVNLSLAIWNLDRASHQATLIYGPTNGNAIWAGFGGPCEVNNDGDPIVLYDHLADRWMVSQFAVGGPYYQCIAVSQTGDPTGAWYRYAYYISDTKMNDYPHFGVWPDAYYMSINQFVGSAWAGTAVAAFERDKMLAGLPARLVLVDLENVNLSYTGMLPSDLDGSPPPDGSPNYFVEVDDAANIGPGDAMRIWEFHVDWINPENSTFGKNGNPNTVLPVANFTPLCPYTTGCISQPDTLQRVDAIGDRLMHRLQFRKFNDYVTLVTNHTVDAGGGRAGIRWYEVRNTGGIWSLYQQGTYAGDGTDSENRWLGSAAMDLAGDIAVGFSISSRTMYPSIHYTGRLTGDPLGTLPQGEMSLIDGSGSQTHPAGRWGDYSMLGVDPTNECTFWFTSEYYPFTSTAGWHTRIGSFTFPGCLNSLKGVLKGVVTDKTNGKPLQNVQVQAGGFSTRTNANGMYQLDQLPAGAYAVTASIYGYQPSMVNDIQVAVKDTITQDFALQPLPSVIVSGVVRDSSGQGWPLYARIRVAAPDYASSIFTNPVTGAYAVRLVKGMPHTFTINAISPGYNAQTQIVIPPINAGSELNRNFGMMVDTTSCKAPGYRVLGTCSSLDGSLIVGNVYDENTKTGIGGAKVNSKDQTSNTAVSINTPEDPQVANGFYALFSPLSGVHEFIASKQFYGSDTLALTLENGTVISQAFYLPAAKLEINPRSVAVDISPSEVYTQVLTLRNKGGLSANYNLAAVIGSSNAHKPQGPFAGAVRRVSPKRLNELTAAGVYDYNPPDVPQLPWGQVLESWPSGLVHPWGIAIDNETGAIWLGNIAAGGGDDKLYRFNPSGTPSGEQIDLLISDATFVGGITYQPFSKKFWVVAVGGENCVVELDLQTLAQTGRSICPAFAHSQRGLAYNPLDDTFFAGSWTSGILYHFDNRGVLLDSTNTGLNISGLAFNPSTRHLFVMTSANKGWDVYVLDTANNNAILGGFNIPGLDDFQQAGLAIDCEGHLWVVNQAAQTVSEVESGETGACTWNNIPWLEVRPQNGKITGHTNQNLRLVFKGPATDLGIYQATVMISNDSPYGSLTVPITLTVRRDYDFLLSPQSIAQSGWPGMTIATSLEITGTGRYTDTYDVMVSGNQWEVTYPSEVGPIGPGESASFPVIIQVPRDVQSGVSDTINLLIKSRGDPSQSAVATLVTTSWRNLFLPFVTTWPPW